jgi:hypothetical protein
VIVKMDGRTTIKKDMMKLIAAFHNSGNAPTSNRSLWSYVVKQLVKYRQT